ncbi:hypothetical protein CC78DRAFT_537429 [Lojkania enalia]|uniref:ASST-domain-containing protein n=1 Tax=Lojkania enalia TaxID=147567 RepID=A0A9P4JYI2_9PLEO|nr:hypothetical protein CC78DRAFT_537429 [Didymosphaeria enalia]
MHHRIALLLSAALPLGFAQDTVSYDYDSYGENDPEGTPFQTFMSNGDVKPPQMHINSNQSGLAPGYVFLGIDGEPTSEQNFPTIFDMSEERMGTLVWTGNYTEPFDFRAQTYQGQPVLTFWSGDLLGGFGHGSYYVLNQSYMEVAHFSPVGFVNEGDIHEFVITSDDTALVPIYHPVPVDLTSVGGDSDAWIYESTFQEINIETGELVFQWNASTHVGFNESFNSLSDVGTEDSPWDFFHINSIEKDINGDFLVSARVMDCIYKISGDDGHIIWRLHGQQSDFDVEETAYFSRQHDARWVDEQQTRMTLFDNGPRDDVEYSRGLLLAVDQDAMTVRLIQEFTNEAQTFGQYEGSLQAINESDSNTNFFLGYGNQPFFAEFDSNGNILLDAQFGKTNVVNSYRAYKLPWQGKPLTKPDIHFDKDGNMVYFSWNGATDVEEWIVYTANSTNTTRWSNVTSARRTGFETTIDLSELELQTYIRGRAVNGTGGTLGWTRAGDGEQFYDAPDGDDSFTSSSTTSTSSMSSTSAVSPTGTDVTTTSTLGPATSSPGPAISPTGGAAVSVQGFVDVIVGVVVVVGVGIL